MFAVFVKAQQPVFIPMKSNAGLSANTIYDIKLAQSGLVYIAHNRGLSSFDGTQYKDIVNTKFANAALSNILETTNGKIFCKSFKNQEFELIDDTLQLQPSYLICQNYYPNQQFENYLLSHTEDSISIFNTSTSQLIKRKIDDNNFATYVHCNPIFAFIKNDENKNETIVWLDEKLKMHQTKTSIKGTASNVFLKFNSTKVVFIQNKNSVYFLDLINPIANTTTTVLDNITVNNVTFFDNKTWICTTTGIYCFDDSNTMIMHILADYNCSDIILTSEKNYIVSTVGEGLLFSPNFQIYYLLNENVPSTFIAGYKNKLLLGTANGDVITYDFEQHKVVSKENLYHHKIIEFIAFDSISNTLITSANNAKFKTKNIVFTENFIIKDIAYLHKNIVLGTNAGLFLLVNDSISTSFKNIIEKSSFKLNYSRLKKIDLVGDERIFCLTINSNNSILAFQSSSGLYFFDIKHNKKTKLPPVNFVITDIIFYENQFIISTKDKGLITYQNNEYEVFKSVGAENFKPIINKLYVYNKELWLYTESGIYKIVHHQLHKFNQNIGLPVDHILGLYIADENAMVNTRNNVLVFNKNSNINEIISPILLVKKLITSKKNYNTSLGNIQLSYTENNIKIPVSLISFANATNTHLAFILNGSEIITLPSDVREINLSSLDHDDYSLKIMSVTNGKIDKGNSITVEFSIAKPFWKTLWFMIVIVMIMIFIIGMIIRKILLRQKKEMQLLASKIKLERELDTSMLASIKSQMNPHFIFNALNTIQSYIYSNDKKSAGVYISKFSDLTRSILQMSNQDMITIAEEVNALQLYLSLEKMRFEDTFHYQIQVAETIDKEFCKIPSMLVQPYVENAIKHGLLHKKNNRQLLIHFSRTQNVLKIIVDDNGVGRKFSNELNQLKNRNHQSFAMNANKKRLEILQNLYGNIQFEIIDKFSDLNQAIGTTVIISMPYKL
ncbi:MAG: hypothetical protein RIQ33_972 [Bacteroidota bacterium]